MRRRVLPWLTIAPLLLLLSTTLAAPSTAVLTVEQMIDAVTRAGFRASVKGTH